MARHWYSIALADVANNLKQAAKTENGFMASEWKPSLIVKVDSLTDEFSDPEGRAKLLGDFVASNKRGTLADSCRAILGGTGKAPYSI